VRALPEWFDKAARETGVPVDIQLHKGYVALLADRLVGFATYTSEYGAGRISWVAVHPDHHGKGIGKELVQTVEDTMSRLGIRKVWVETVGWSEPPNEPYARTRGFYGSVGYQVAKKSMVHEAQGHKWQMFDFMKELD
jgi:GNAT superfamily N-acetyltransferase